MAKQKHTSQDAQAQDKKPAPAKKVPGLRVTSKREGFRRAGRAWSTRPVEIPVSELTKDEISALKAEPMLTVEDIEIEAGE